MSQWSDVKQLKQEHISVDNTGTIWIRKRRQKTNNMCNIPLMDIAQQILEKYSNHPARKNGALLVVPSNQKFNAYLKEIAALCGIDKPVTFLFARHSFATTITLSNGVPIESVSKMLGHTNIKTTQIYARITDQKVSRDMDALAEKLNAVGI